MAATGYTPISLYYSTTASAVPTAGNLANGELALNIADMKLYAKNSSGTVTLLASSGGAAGTVSSVAQSFTGGLISVSGSPITTSGTLALTVAGTSGGIPYFSSASTWATSAALAASSLVVGGGAGAAPSTVTTGTGVVTALGVNTGSAGAFVVNGGALGTPSSGTVTNLTGTASININGTVGATTPTTGAFTTLSASSTVTLSGGTANGVTYLNGSNVLTSGSALTFDGTNLGVNNTSPSSLGRFVVTGSAGSTYVISTGNGLSFSRAGANYIRSSNAASTLVSEAPTFTWFAEDGITERMRLTSTGLGIGTSSPNAVLSLNNSGVNNTLIQFRRADVAKAYVGTSYTTNDVLSGAAAGDLNIRAETGGNINFGTNSSTSLNMRIDSAGNLGLGVTPSAWGSGYRALDINTYGGVLATTSEVDVLGNLYYNGSSWVAKTTGLGTRYLQTSGIHYWQNSASVSAGATATLSTKMTLDSAGNLGLGVTPSAWTAFTGLQVGALGGLNLGGSVDDSFVGSNAYYNSNWYFARPTTATYASIYRQIGGQHRFYTSSATGTAGNVITWTQAMTLDASGNLGIGTTSPANLLHVNGSNSVARFSGTSTSLSAYQTFFNNSAAQAYFGIESSSGTGIIGTGAAYGMVLSTASTNPLCFGTNATERARIDSSGNFGIGTNAPVAKLDIAGDYKEGVVTANTSTAYTISLATGTVQILTLTGNCTYTFPTPVAGKSFTLVQKQDATGGRTVTWPASVKWPGGTAPTLTSTASKADKFIFTAIDGSSWLGSNGGQNYTV